MNLTNLDHDHAVYLMFSTTAEWVSRGIRFFTNSDYSHVDIVTRGGRLFGSHIVGRNGVWCRERDYQDFTRRLLARIVVPDAKAVRYAAFRQAGKPFDYTAVINFGLQRDWTEDDSWFCSELVAYAFQQSGQWLFNPWGVPGRITPRDITIHRDLELVDEWHAPGWEPRQIWLGGVE